jgi:hypothetical protein
VKHATRALLAFVATSAFTLPSRAQEFIAFDHSLAEGSGNWGFSGDLRAGYRTGLSRVTYGWIFQFELVGGYRQLFASTGDLHMGRIGGGVRSGFSVYWLQFLGFVHGSAADANGIWGELLDFGGAVDWRFKTWSAGTHYAHGILHLDSGWSEFNEVGIHFEFRGFWLE